MHWIEGKSQRVRLKKQYLGEWLEIISICRKMPMKGVSLTKEQKHKIQAYWGNAYGKKIPTIWHRKYYSHSEKFDEKFFPEVFYTTKLEPSLNNDNVAKVLSDKNMIELLFAKVLDSAKGIKVPETLFGCSNGFYFDKYRNPICKDVIGKELESISGEFIIKPTIESSSGNGVKKIILLNGIDTLTGQSVMDIVDLYGKNFIVQEKIIQHEKYSELHPWSINTIRIMSYRVEGQIKTAPMIMRIGINENYLDNAHAGGIYVAVSNKGIMQKYAMKYDQGKYEVHPNSKIRFEGYKLPFINRIIDAAIELHKCVPQIGFINWDFSVDSNENIVLIEANMMCGGIWTFQNAWGCGVFGEDTEYMVDHIKNYNLKI